MGFVLFLLCIIPRHRDDENQETFYAFKTFLNMTYIPTDQINSILEEYRLSRDTIPKSANRKQSKNKPVI